VRILIPAQECTPNTTRNAVVKRRDRRINENFPSRRHELTFDWGLSTHSFQGSDVDLTVNE
jgi:ATP-dependent exoDNAse (exonuclease V) alpha subunit